jgi:chitin synthase
MFFWNDLIKKYLYPIDANKDREAKIAQGLKDLRDKSVFMFGFFNALYVLVVFMLTLPGNELYTDWPFGANDNITITEDEQVIITAKLMKLEPIGIVLVLFFLTVIIIQFTGMIIHRMGTFGQILATTDVFNGENNGLEAEETGLDLDKKAIEIVKEMQKLQDQEEEEDKPTIKKANLDIAFRQKYFG